MTESLTTSYTFPECVIGEINVHATLRRERVLNSPLSVQFPGLNGLWETPVGPTV